MRLLVVPFIFVAMLVQMPAPVFGNANQASADKIANAIGERFPDADIEIQFKGGRVWLKGEAVSQDQRKNIVEFASKVPGVNVTDVQEEIKIAVPKAVEPAQAPVPAARPAVSAVTAPVPMPNVAAPQPGVRAPVSGNNSRQVQTPQMQPQQQQPQAAGAAMAPYPYQHYAAAYGLKPGQPSAVPAPYAPNAYAVPGQQPMPQQPVTQQYAGQYQPAYGPQGQMAYHPEAYGPQGPLPGQYNQPNLPDYAWPAYANYPNYAQVSYPRSYSPKAWPYIGPFYPYPQVPMGWRKVTLEHHDGWWWLDFDDGAPSGPFSGLFRQPQQYTY
jgi:hypothetical protein